MLLVRSVASQSSSMLAPLPRPQVLLSSMETTNPHPNPFEGGAVLFWKLNAEAFLEASGISRSAPRQRSRHSARALRPCTRVSFARRTTAESRRPRGLKNIMT